MRQRFHLVRTGLDGGGFAVNGRIGMMRFDEADVVEQKFIAAGGGELALLEQHADFRRGSVHVVRINLNDDRHVVRRAALIRDVFHDEFFAADARALVDGALDGILGHAFLLGLFHGGEEARVHRGIRAAHFGGDGDFANKFSGRAALFQAGDQSFGMQPLASHRRAG